MATNENSFREECERLGLALRVCCSTHWQLIDSGLEPQTREGDHNDGSDGRSGD